MLFRISDFLFPLQPTPPYADKTPGCPTSESLISVHFGSISVLFGSIWVRLGPFRVYFGSVWGPFGVLDGVGVGSGRGAAVREKNITIQDG